MVKVTHQGEGLIKVKENYLHLFKLYVAHTLCKQVVCIQLKCYLFVFLLKHKYKNIRFNGLLCATGKNIDLDSDDISLIEVSQILWTQLS